MRLEEGSCRVERRGLERRSCGGEGEGSGSI